MCSSLTKLCHHKYILLCVISGISSIILGLCTFGVYNVISYYTSSTYYFQTIPTNIPATTLIINGIIVLILSKKRFRFPYLMKLTGLICLLTGLLYVVIVVTTSVLHMSRLNGLGECTYTSSTRSCTCEEDGKVPSSHHYLFLDIPNCESLHGPLYLCLRIIFGLSVVTILLSIFTSMLVYSLSTHEAKKRLLESSLGGDGTFGPYQYPSLLYPPHVQEVWGWPIDVGLANGRDNLNLGAPIGPGIRIGAVPNGRFHQGLSQQGFLSSLFRWRRDRPLPMIMPLPPPRYSRTVRRDRVERMRSRASLYEQWGPPPPYQEDHISANRQGSKESSKSESMCSTPREERRLLCNAFVGDGIKLRIGPPCCNEVGKEFTEKNNGLEIVEEIKGCSSLVNMSFDNSSSSRVNDLVVDRSCYNVIELNGAGTSSMSSIVNVNEYKVDWQRDSGNSKVLDVKTDRISRSVQIEQFSKSDGSLNTMTQDKSTSRNDAIILIENSPINLKSLETRVSSNPTNISLVNEELIHASSMPNLSNSVAMQNAAIAEYSELSDKSTEKCNSRVKEIDFLKPSFDTDEAATYKKDEDKILQEKGNNNERTDQVFVSIDKVTSGDTSTSQDVADLELELDEEPIYFIPDLPLDDEVIMIDEQLREEVYKNHKSIGNEVDSCDVLEPASSFRDTPKTLKKISEDEEEKNLSEKDNKNTEKLRPKVLEAKGSKEEENVSKQNTSLLNRCISLNESQDSKEGDTLALKEYCVESYISSSPSKIGFNIFKDSSSSNNHTSSSAFDDTSTQESSNGQYNLEEESNQSGKQLSDDFLNVKVYNMNERDNIIVTIRSIQV